MKIASADIQFFTEYSQRRHERDQAFVDARVATTRNDNNQSLPNQKTTRNLQLEQRVSLNSNQSASTYSSSQIRAQGEQALTTVTTQKAVNSVLSRFYSQSVRLSQTELLAGSRASLPGRETSSDVSLRSGEYYEFQSQQQLGFVARGTINTEDGREIAFEFYAKAQQDFSYQSGSGRYAEQITRRTDPLVINLEGDFNHLSSAAFQFDLNNDGEQEELAFAGRGSGFLVLDKNQDGRINNGSELFGPETGNGFSELAAYDDDGNGFIDAGDAVYDRLQVWTKDSEGNDQLRSLKEVDVAAIGVESGYSPFAITDDYNNALGQAQRTGIFVRESGAVGSVQQLDLYDRDPEREQKLGEEFDQGERLMEQQRSEQTPGADGAGASFDLEGLKNAMTRLDTITGNLLQRQDELAKLEDDEAPKSLLAQIVESLEQETLKRQQAQEDESNK